MKSVCVLLSTYNGEKYLKDQLDSLLKQKGIAIHILIRDDGSTDSTVDIIAEYKQKSSCIEFYRGDNLGPAKSFFDLISKAPMADYYAFCDQDDIWDSEKLRIATDFLEKEAITEPSMYYSNLRIVDQHINFYRLSHATAPTQENKYSALTEDMATGCTIVFNAAAKNLAKNNMPEYCSMHDTWIYLICKFFGVVVYDRDAHLDYRQHDNNVVGTYLEKKSFNLYISRIKRLFNRDLQPRYNNARSFYKCFKNKLSDSDTKQLLKLVYYKSSLKNRLRLFFDMGIHATSKSRDIRYRLLILLGIV